MTEFAADGIRMNAVMPGGVNTGSAQKIKTDPSRNFMPKGPIMMHGRMLLVQAESIQLASAILFLCTPASNHMTGHVIAVDGVYSVG